MKYLLTLIILVFSCNYAQSKEININYGSNSIDINNDGKLDLIIKSRIEIGNAHSYDQFDILISKNEKFYKVSNNFKTIEGADCILQNYKFINNSIFKIVEYSRQVGKSYYSKEDVYKKEYIFSYKKDFIPGNNPYSFKQISNSKLRKKYCDVNKIKN